MRVQVEKMACSLMPLLDDAKPFIEAANRLEAAGQIAIAGALLSEAERQFPRDETVFTRRTDYIERHHGADAGFARWVMMSHRFSDRDRIVAGLVRRHREAGRLHAAETIVAEALAAKPDSQIQLVEAPLVARARGDLHETARRWQIALQRHPGWPEAVRAHNIAVAELNVRALDSSLESSAPPASANDGYLLGNKPDAARWRDLFMHFESLGDGCEFGAVQRHFGAELLGLFRWAAIAVPDLVRALDNGLEELLHSDDAFLIPYKLDYHLRVPRARFQMHTHVEPDNPDAFLDQMRRRLHYLARKLLEDLRDGEKIFVFKDTVSPLSEFEISALHAAVRQHGSGQVLCVLAADGAHRVGSLERRDGGLWVGRMPPGSTHENADTASWLKICSAIAEASP
jgi:hypothetical protein